MDTDEQLEQFNREAEAIKTIFSALKGLDRVAQTLVIDYVTKRLDLKIAALSFLRSKLSMRSLYVTLP